MEVGKVVVGDGSAFRRDTYSVVKSSGLSQELDSRGIEFIDLNYDELVPVKARYGWPKNIIHMNGISPVILGLYQSLPPVVSVIDGIVGMEGNGPLFGKPVQHGLLAAGCDPLAVDIICAQLMGFSIDTIPHLSGGAWAGVGQARRIETRGVSPDQLQRHYASPRTLSIKKMRGRI